MRIGYDAKRLFCNHRGLGNYSRDLIRILNQYYPENQYDLYTPNIKIDFQINSQNTQIIQPSGIYKLLPSSVWRSVGIKSDIKRLGDEIFHGLSQELPIGIEKISIKKVITFHDAIFIRYPELYPSTYRRIFTLIDINRMQFLSSISKNKRYMSFKRLSENKGVLTTIAGYYAAAAGLNEAEAIKEINRYSSKFFAARKRSKPRNSEES